MSEATTDNAVQMRPIADIAADLGLENDAWEPMGRYKAKIDAGLYRRLPGPTGKLIYTTAVTATPAGEGKTTVAIGLTEALGHLGKRAAVCLREPSLGPVFGIKGGATGSGRSQVVPADEINLHFTGDIHAVTSSHNLLAALLDNHLMRGNALRIDPKRVIWRRVMDMNDRQLRNIVVGLGRPVDGVVRETGFDISVASEVMAILCLATDYADLKARLGRMLVAYTYEGEPVYAADLNAAGAMTALLKDALRPNLVQTYEGQPAFIHGGPFANIAHGNNSVIATHTALKLVDYVVTEGGFAADLGAEKFFDIVHGYSGLTPDVAVVVATVRALNMHGGVAREHVAETNLEALQAGLANLDHHVGLMHKFGLPVVVALNRFPTDSEEELRLVRAHCEAMGVPVGVANVVAEGGAGGAELAAMILDVLATQPTQFKPLYDWSLSIPEKLDLLAREVYGADGVDLSPAAMESIEQLTKLGYAKLPVCVAKTQHSISDDPQRKGAPTGWRLQVREVRPSLGVGFLVCLTGDVMTMPGLPEVPASERIDVDPDGNITGLR